VDDDDIAAGQAKQLMFAAALDALDRRAANTCAIPRWKVAPLRRVQRLEAPHRPPHDCAAKLSRGVLHFW
jgi:hypothetical protein